MGVGLDGQSSVQMISRHGNNVKLRQAYKAPYTFGLTISADLPFAQKRFCAAEGIDQHQLLSDSVWRDFGLKYGLLIKDMGLLTRALLIIDAQGIIKYQQIVPQLSQFPDYAQALDAVKHITEQ